MEQVIEIITKYGLETVILALIINLFTGLIKMPVKSLAKRTKDSSKITRFIVFLPILLGFGITFCYFQFILKGFSFNRAFITEWLTSSSLSLTFYAVFEKIIPNKKSALTEKEIEESEQIIEEVKEITDAVLTETEKAEEKKECKKIILGGNRNVKTEIEK